MSRARRHECDDAPTPRSADPRFDALFCGTRWRRSTPRYAAALDEQRLSDWVEMFTDDALYVVISRENADRGMPVV